MTTTVKVILAAIGLGTITTVVSVYQAHTAAESAIVSELKREDQERLLERQREAQEREQARLKKQTDEAAVRAWLTQPLRFTR
jgi:hypothetical protein